jgi:hypothetical protein
MHIDASIILRKSEARLSFSSVLNGSNDLNYFEFFFRQG